MAEQVVVRSRYHLHWPRLGLRIAAAVVLVICLITEIVGASASCPNSDGVGWCFPVVSLPFVCFALIWNISEFITTCVNKKGIFPGAHIALDMIICAGLAFGGPVDIVRGIADDGALVAAGIFNILASLLHFVLFVLDCVAVHHWRRSRSPKIIYVERPMGVQQPQIMVAGNAAGYPMVYPSLQPLPPGMVYMVPMQQNAPPPPGMQTVVPQESPVLQTPIPQAPPTPQSTVNSQQAVPTNHTVAKDPVVETSELGP